MFRHKEDNESNQLIYSSCIGNIVAHEKVLEMSKYISHSSINCLDHSVFVSYYSFLVCKRLGYDYISAARGALLHDFYLYDWHIKGTRTGLHGFTHPKVALYNANRYFDLTGLEKDIILKHMWPLTLKLPKYKESFIVAFIDKICATLEIFRFVDNKKLQNLSEKLLNVV